MRSYTIVVNGKEFNINVNELAADRFQVLLDDRQFEVQLADDSELPQATISPAMASAVQTAQMQIAPAMAPVAATSTAAANPYSGGAAPAPAAKGAAPAAGASKSVTAPMPGAIISVDVEPGTRVQRGQVLLTLEAMKMYNAIRAPRDGVVAEILVQGGQQVAYGDVLIRFEE